jgi:hypothetical protein
MDVAEDLRQYLALKDQLKLLTDRQNEIKNRLIEAVDLEQADDRGHRIMTVDNDAFGTVSMTRQRRVSKNLDMQVAEDILTKKGIKDQCIKMVPMIDESAIMSAFYENYLTEEDIDAMFPAKVSYAFIVDNK